MKTAQPQAPATPAAATPAAAATHAPASPNLAANHVPTIRAASPNRAAIHVPIPHEARRHASGSRGCSLAVGGALVLALLACQSETKPAGAEPAADSKDPAAAASAAGKQAADEAKAASAAAAEAAGTSKQVAGKCPAGRWHYDYSDQALEVMMKNVANAKVVKEEGDFVCTISAGDEGTIFCDTGPTPVHNVVETTQAGMPMSVSVKLQGKGTTRFKRLAEGRLEIASSDTKELKLEASVTLAGKNMPFPAEKMISIFGDQKSILLYKCEGDNLLMKPELDNAKTDWQEFTPAK